MNQQSIKKQQLFSFLLVTAIVVVVNILSSYVFTRIDLTEDKRFTLSSNTKELMKQLDDVVFFKIYLEGDLPPDFKRLRNEVEDKLAEMRIYSNGNLGYEFIDAAAIENEQQREALYKQLYQKGLMPTTLQLKENDASTQKIIFPGAIINSNNLEQAITFLQEQMGVGDAQMLNNSIRNLEYQITSTVKKITQKAPYQLCFLEGQGELPNERVGDINKTLSESYVVQRKAINGLLGALDNYRVVIIAKPDTAFTEKDKFVLDQYIMKGGRVLWLIDQAHASMDSLASSDEAIATSVDLNLNDMPFRYGARVNFNLLCDLQGVPIPIITGNVGNQPKFTMVPWMYFPMIFPGANHAFVNNLNALKTEFISTIDTIAVQGVKKTFLLYSSPYSRELNLPSRFTLEAARKKPNMTLYDNGRKAVAVLLEGNFTSTYKNRIPPAIANDSAIAFKETSKPTKMIVMSDGDIISNNVNKSNGQIYPCGYDRYNNRMFGNKSLMLNMIDFLADDSNLIELRNKEVKLRLLDKNLIAENEMPIKLINVGVPILLLLIFGIAKFAIRKRRYAS